MDHTLSTSKPRPETHATPAFVEFPRRQLSGAPLRRAHRRCLPVTRRVAWLLVTLAVPVAVLAAWRSAPVPSSLIGALAFAVGFIASLAAGSVAAYVVSAAFLGPSSSVAFPSRVERQAERVEHLVGRLRHSGADLTRAAQGFCELTDRTLAGDGQQGAA